MIFRLAFLCVIFLLPAVFSGQVAPKKGTFYAVWGYNRSWYSNSDIHFSGEGYDFTLWDTPATDKPEKFKASIYLNPTKFTIPQFNFRAGYHLSEKYAVSLGWDHMKYFMKENIYVNVTGYLEEEAHNYYSFDLDNEPFFLARNFMEYEHSDGFNYVRTNINRYDQLFSKGNFRLDWTSGIGLGTALTWSDLSWGSTRYRNKLHLSGINVSVNTGPELQFKNRIFLNSTLMAGQSWLFDVAIRHGYPDHKAKQNFQFYQFYIAMGYRFSIGNKSKQEKN